MSNIILRNLLSFPTNPPAGTAKVFVEDGRFQVIDEDGNSILPAGGDADQVAYDPSVSGLSATDVQGAIDEIVAGGGGGGGITPEQAEQLSQAFNASDGHVVIEVRNGSSGTLSPGEFVTDYKINTALFTQFGFIKNHTPDGDDYNPDPDLTERPESVIRVVPISTLYTSAEDGMEPWANFGVLGTLNAIPRVLRVLEEIPPGETGKALLRGWAFTDNDIAPGFGAPVQIGSAYINTSGELTAGNTDFNPTAVSRWAGELVASPFLFAYIDTTPTPTLPIVFTYPNAPLRDDTLSALGPVAGGLSGRDGNGDPQQFFILSNGDIINDATSAVVGSCNFATGEITITTDFQLLEAPDGTGFINVFAAPVDSSLRSLVYFDGERGEFMPQSLFRAEPQNIPDSGKAYLPYFNTDAGRWSWQRVSELPGPAIETDTTILGDGSLVSPLGVAPASLNPDRFSNGTMTGQSFVWDGAQWELSVPGYPWSVGPGQVYSTILEAETDMDAASVFLPILLYPGSYEVYNGLNKPLVGISGSGRNSELGTVTVVFNAAIIESPFVDNIVFDDAANFQPAASPVYLKGVRTSTPTPLTIAATEITLENCTGFSDVICNASNEIVNIHSCEMESLSLGGPTVPVIARVEDTRIYDPNTLTGGMLLASGALETNNLFSGKIDFTATFLAGVGSVTDTLRISNSHIRTGVDDPIEIKGSAGVPSGGYTFKFLDTRIDLSPSLRRLSVDLPSGSGLPIMGLFEMAGCETNLTTVEFLSTGGDSGGGDIRISDSSFTPSGDNPVFLRTAPAVSLALYWNVQYEPAGYVSEEGGSPTTVNGFSDEFPTVNPMRTSIP